MDRLVQRLGAPSRARRDLRGPPQGGQPAPRDRRRPYFRRLRLLAEENGLTGLSLGLSMGGLSMGMSHDFETAIEEGATLVRIGTALFGPRNRA